MPIHTLKLLAKQDIARNTVAFHFEKPIGLQFKPGQYGGFTLINPSETDAGGITRRFSLACSPEDNTLSIAMRIQPSAYKRVLNALPLGSEIKFAGPTGIFTLHEESQTPAVFIAGGIGITPFYSMLASAAKERSTREFILFYGNQTPADAAFLTELETLAKALPRFRFIPVMVEASEWSGETGYITDSLLKKYISDISKPIYYVCGSPAMVTALQETLMEMDINEKNIRVEDFPGY